MQTAVLLKPRKAEDMEQTDEQFLQHVKQSLEDAKQGKIRRVA